MAAKRRKKRSNSGAKSTASNRRRPAVKSEQELNRDKEITGIILIAISILLLLSFLFAPEQDTAEISAFGIVSLYLIKTLRFLAGHGAVMLPIFLLIFGILVCIGRNQQNSRGRLAGLTLIFLSVLGFIHLNQQITTFDEYINLALKGDGGGVIGALLDYSLLKTIGRVGAIIILAAFALIGVLLSFETSLRQILGAIGSGWQGLAELLSFDNRAERRSRRQQGEAGGEIKRKPPLIITPDDPAPLIGDAEPSSGIPPIVPAANAFVRNFMPSIGGADAEAADVDTAAAPDKVKEQAVASAPEIPPRDNIVALPTAQQQPVDGPPTVNPDYMLPPVDLIDAGIKVRNPRMNKIITDNIAILESALDNFGVKATVTQVVAGPSVTRYELQPAPGVKVARITSLADDIALSLAAQSVRIEAPIPGKSAIGIEVARKDIDTVYFREMVESENFQKAKSKMSVALGKNIGGEAVVTDLTKMPHLLIAGTTGSGKSICINCIICSILYKARPDEVKIMLIDPKKVELTAYHDLPHLIAPVINDSKKASNALKWAVNEMENRYTLFAGEGVKDISGYNATRPEAPMCKIVVVIDELADLMLVARHDVEDSICRLAQLARAAGIHLVVATQRPSVDVITGLIKANIPSRIAFTVSSPVDSRTILDTGGAEKLLGRGDMLFDPIGNNKPIRIQGTFINEKDVARLVKYCRSQADPAFFPNAVEAVDTLGSFSAATDEDLDDLFFEAGMLIINTGQASTSFLQRRLAIGNPRAARIMDTLEAKGVVGGPNGSKPRDVL
ncbi:MAG: DNA translocase FtsK, partial [Clostridia bacterium]|nr:DNA translocase FtsK [Clostridia bacterium]